MKRILVGDSHASGLAAAAQRAGRPFTATQTFSGQRTRTIAASGWVGANAAGADEVWIVSSGNDRSPDVLGPHVQSLLAQAQGARVVWLGPATSLEPLVDAEHAGTTAKLKELLSSSTFIDSRPLTLTGHAPDGVHFTSAGYDAWFAGAEEAAERRSKLPMALGIAAGALGVLAGVFAAFQLRR